MADPGSIAAVLIGTKLFMRAQIARLEAEIAKIDELFDKLTEATGVDESVDKPEQSRPVAPAAPPAARPGLTEYIPSPGDPGRRRSWQRDLAELRRLVALGVRPVFIATKLNRTEASVYSKMAALRLTKRGRDKSVVIGDNPRPAPAAERVQPWPAEAQPPGHDAAQAPADSLFPKPVTRRCDRCGGIFAAARASEIACRHCVGRPRKPGEIVWLE